MHRPDSQRSCRMTNKKSTSKIIARLTYIPKKHKQKVTRKLRQKLQEQPLPDQPLQTPFLFFLLGPKPGHRLPRSQVIGEKVTPLTVEHTYRVPYLHSMLSTQKPTNQGYSHKLPTSSPRHPGRFGPVICFIN